MLPIKSQLEQHMTHMQGNSSAETNFSVILLVKLLRKSNRAFKARLHELSVNFEIMLPIKSQLEQHMTHMKGNSSVETDFTVILLVEPLRKSNRAFDSSITWIICKLWSVANKITDRATYDSCTRKSVSGDKVLSHFTRKAFAQQ